MYRTDGRCNSSSAETGVHRPRPDPSRRGTRTICHGQARAIIVPTRGSEIATHPEHTITDKGQAPAIIVPPQRQGPAYSSGGFSSTYSWCPQWHHLRDKQSRERMYA
ncbi:hypothetical protein AVEN_244695-1 [Araneus ventricosus]|uniref:Uncharacterized protein n=1 Tax=Araneus ventricosus TaxID=182803 RepID=A0A4Y2UTX4_ARAVE|nr:hypothetical protein AVEN_244695-1 [Araneus ventricosus]